MNCTPSRELVAHGAGCQVERCSCGTLHLSIGAVTLKMDAAMFEAVLPTLITAGERLLRSTEPAGYVARGLRS
jgi:hypothetical protein